MDYVKVLPWCVTVEELDPSTWILQAPELGDIKLAAWTHEISSWIWLMTESNYLRPMILFGLPASRKESHYRDLPMASSHYAQSAAYLVPSWHTQSFCSQVGCPILSQAVRTEFTSKQCSVNWIMCTQVKVQRVQSLLGTDFDWRKTVANTYIRVKDAYIPKCSNSQTWGIGNKLQVSLQVVQTIIINKITIT